MTRAARPNSGVTLMELLVAMTLLSLLSVGILFAMRIGLTAMERSKSRFMTNRRVLGVERILTEQIAGFVPSKADCRSNPDGPPQRLPFFQGEPGTMRFVSTYSLQDAWRGHPRIVEFQVIPGEEGRGVRLVVNELAYSGPLSTGVLCVGQAMDQLTGRPAVIFRPVQIGLASFVLADKLAHCRFEFREDRELPLPPIWHQRWTGFRTPAAVRIDMTPLEPDPSRLQVPSIVAPFRPNRDPVLPYGEVM